VATTPILLLVACRGASAVPGRGDPAPETDAARLDGSIECGFVGAVAPCSDLRGTGVGFCAEGTRICTEDGWGACQANVPKTETCNGVDDDCDGEVDNGPVARCLGVGCAEPFAPGRTNAEGVLVDSDGALHPAGEGVGEHTWRFQACGPPPDYSELWGADWCSASWKAVTPGASYVTFDMRVAWDANELPDSTWEPLASTATSSSPAGVEGGCWGPRWAEMRVRLFPENAWVAPTLLRVALSWDCIHCY
jgi:hypothetical protein